jgi:dipeptidase E
VPYALGNRDEYATTARKPFEAWGFEFSSIHESEDPVGSVKAADAIFIGGGNTFRLLKELYDHKVFSH